MTRDGFGRSSWWTDQVAALKADEWVVIPTAGPPQARAVQYSMIKVFNRGTRELCRWTGKRFRTRRVGRLVLVYRRD